MADRYNRQTILREVGPAGQARLKAAKVLLVGVGGLGCPLATYLAAAGVGKLGLVDPDKVSLDNLHRQTLYTTEEVGEPKAAVAAHRLKEMNPDVEVQVYEAALDSSNALDLIKDYDIVCDGTDNFVARYAINDACVALGKTNVHASVFQFHGHVSVFAPGGPCYRCLFPRPPVSGFAPSCAEAGVLGSVVGVIGTLQATEVLKLLLGVGDPLIGRLLMYDGLSATFESVEVAQDPACPCCGPNPDSDLLRESIEVCEPSNSKMVFPLPEITPIALKAELDGPNPPLLLDVREAEELEISAFPDALHIPMGELEDRFDEIGRDRPIVVVCRSGARSAQVTIRMLMEGFPSVRNLSSGINGWAREVDTSLREY